MRYVSTAPPTSRPPREKRRFTNLPKRLELSLRSVMALPNDSSSGFDESTFSKVERDVSG